MIEHAQTKPIDIHLAQQWRQALAGDSAASSLWQELDGSEWIWRSDGVRVKGTGPEWLGLLWQGWNEALLNSA